MIHHIKRPIMRMANNPLILTAGVVATLVVGMLAFVALEGASFLDGIYWASTTLTSVGYGDFSPTTAGGKVMTIVFQLWSIFVLLPCAIVNIIEAVKIDEHKMTNDEQEWLFNSVETIAANLGGTPLPPQPSDY